ncbi:MAG TPA: AsmA-like C-terminal domain-containing protein [Sulfuricurvum sp.]|nr:AsmA-like C-terminal domain-containing protein [Sulfuricurvum sp.]
MNDKIIIKIIAKIHFKLLLFFLFLFVAGFFAFVALVEGFTISHLKLGDIKLEQLYLKWDNRLHIKASLVDLSDLTADDEPLTLKPLQKLPKGIRWMEEWVSSIDIHTIRYHDTNVSLHYVKHSMGILKVQASDHILEGTFTLTPSRLKASLSSVGTQHVNLKSRLTVFIPEQKLEGTVTLQLPNSPALKAYAQGDQKSLHLRIVSDGTFSTLESLVDFFKIDPKTKPWITEYAQASQLTLHHCAGDFLYDQPETLLKRLNVHASIDNAAYTFAQGIAPIKAKKVTLNFYKGKLHILPQNGTFYALPTEKSRLYIDFTTPHTMLHAHINTDHGQLNDSILSLLENYHITVPIRQNSGLCRVNLALGINLHDFNTTAKGEFIPGPSELQLDTFIFQTTGGAVTLDTTKVAFKGFEARYKNMIHTRVNGAYDAHSGKGHVEISPLSCFPTENPKHAALLTSLSQTKAIYHIDPLQDRIQVTPSQWKILNETLNVEGFNLPFDYKNPSAAISNLHYSIPSKIEGTLDGHFTAAQWQLKLGIAKFHLNDLELRGSPFTIAITHDKSSTKLASPVTSHWRLNGQNFSLSPLTAKEENDNVIFNNIKIKIDSIIQGSMSGAYHLSDKTGSLLFNDIIPLNPKIAHYIDLKKEQKLSVHTSDDTLTLHSERMGIDLTTAEEGWKITIPDIALISNNSPLLHHYQINNGYVNLFYMPANESFTFSGEVNYPYKLLVINNQSLSRYRFSGSLKKGKAVIRVNDRLMIQYDNGIKIRANNVGINAPELTRWLALPDTRSPSDSNTIQMPIRLNATNTYLYLMENRKLMADTLDATLQEGKLDARLEYGQGSADIEMYHDLFYVTGSHFNDRFMEHLFVFSDFKGGDLSFKISGKTDAFEGIMRIENATLKEYKLLNNVLAFIDTVPSLATFSLPDFDAKGLPVKEAYTHFTYANHEFNADNFTMDSPQIRMLGNVNVNFTDDTIAGLVTLKTNFGSKLSKVPVVGYILLGEDGSLSTTMKIKGKLSDPVVETAFAQEIITAPYQLLKRTVTYPFLWMMDDEKKK